jgi:hypothetical protein
VGYALGLERLHRGEGGERRVAVVRSASAVEPVAAPDGRPRPQALTPADHLGLLVEVAVQEDRLVGVPRDLHENDGRPARQPDDLDLEALDRTLARPAGGELDGPIQVAVGLPLAVEAGRLRGDADVLLERGDDSRVPRVLDEGTEPTRSGFAYSLVNAAGRPALMAALSEVPAEVRGAILGLNVTMSSVGWLEAAAVGGWL